MANILLLERRSDTRAAITAQIVAQDGWSVFAAQSLEEALTLLRSGPIDLVVADLGAMVGTELIAEASPVPVVVTSARDQMDGLIDALEAGAANYIPGHLIPDRLVRAIQAALSSALTTSKRTKLLGLMKFSQSSFSIPTDLAMLSVAADRMQASLELFGLCEDSETMHVRIALDEALANAFYHGNLGVSSDLKEGASGDFEQLAQERLRQRPYCDRRIEIEEHLTRNEARFVIRDEGTGFDISCLADPTDGDHLTRCSGRGILMMRYFLDEVRYNETGNEVTLIKRAAAPPSEEIGGEAPCMLDADVGSMRAVDRELEFAGCC